MSAATKVLFFVEGNTDIRFVLGLSEICSLTMAVPANIYNGSDLKERCGRPALMFRWRRFPGIGCFFSFPPFCIFCEMRADSS